MGKCGPRRNQTNIYRSKDFDESYSKCSFYWIWATVSKVMGVYVKFTKTTEQIWSCHVTLASNSENFYFSPNFILNFRKSYQIWGKLAQAQKSYRQKQIGRCKTPAYRVKQYITPWKRFPRCICRYFRGINLFSVTNRGRQGWCYILGQVIAITVK